MQRYRSDEDSPAMPDKALNGSFSCTSSAAALIRPSFSAAAKAFSSTRPPRAVFTKKAPEIRGQNKQDYSLVRVEIETRLTRTHLFDGVFIDEMMIVFVKSAVKGNTIALKE